MMSYSSNPASSAPTNTGSDVVLYSLFPRFPYFPNPHVYTYPCSSIIPVLFGPAAPNIDGFVCSFFFGYTV